MDCYSNIYELWLSFIINMRQFGLILLLLASYTLAMEHSSCSTITCSSTKAAAGSNCVTVSGSTVTLNPCEDGSYCNGIEQFQSDDNHYNAQCNTYSTSTSDPCPSYHSNQLSTYLYCCQNSDCASNNCDTSNNECIGIAEDGACSSSDACEADLYCSGGSSGTCVPTKSNKKSCSNDYECDPGYGCYGSSFCLQYFSLDDGEATFDDKFCKSGISKNYKCDSVSIYVNGNKVSEPWACTIGQTCTYTWTIAGNSYTDSSTCECDGKGSNTGYCPIRDLPAITGYSDDFYEKFQYDSSDCSGSMAHITSLNYLSSLVYCNSIDQDGLDYRNEMIMIKEAWSLYASGQIDDCASDMGIFDPSEDIDSWDSAEFLALSGLLILLN
ncbi:unnamed protein product [Blepharisma stoltei]|uniref:Uncharacterized protein n=1 Tax=Blepharisma stoltei TaxID=1481888 RepID=A0AAU9JK84_9CILI|nr:unnamed protein product [Blepharisma stoltei]